MTARPVATLLILLALAACDSAPAETEAGSPAHVTAAAKGGDLGLNFAGRWGPSQEECDIRWWDFAAEQVRLADGLTCLFQRETPVANGLQIEMACVGEGVSNVERWELTALPDRKMSVVRDNSAPVILERCSLYDLDAPQPKAP
ncbi:MAG: hypothetical protein INF91_05890 [Alphaproteobacteria bacterium]|nr:hypothetical protein [Alphaproteobacteria bacterium]